MVRGSIPLSASKSSEFYSNDSSSFPPVQCDRLLLKTNDMKAKQTITSPGIYNISIEDYHAGKEWTSATGVKHFQKSAAEYKLYLDGYFDEEEKPCFDFGNAVELYLIDRKGYNKKVAIAQDSLWVEEALAENEELKSPRASSTYKELKKEFEAENKGKYIINDFGKESFESLSIISARCQADPWIPKLLDGIDYQSSCYWIDQETGLQMKCRPDVVNKKHNVLINIKTALDASPDAFSRNLAKLNYPIQACVEIAGAEASGLLPKVEKYFWLVLEKNAPFNCQLYEFSMGDVAVVFDEYRSLLRGLKKCYDANEWPGYGAYAQNQFGILEAKIPAWYLMRSNQ